MSARQSIQQLSIKLVFFNRQGQLEPNSNNFNRNFTNSQMERSGVQTQVKLTAENAQTKGGKITTSKCSVCKRLNFRIWVQGCSVILCLSLLLLNCPIFFYFLNNLIFWDSALDGDSSKLNQNNCVLFYSNSFFHLLITTGSAIFGSMGL